MKNDNVRAALRLSVQMSHYPTLRAYLEEAGRVFGLSSEACSHLTLAGEEIFAYVCEHESGQGEIEVVSHAVGHQLRTAFTFEGAHFDPWAFNIGARISMDDDASLDELGLLLASRMVDSFAIHPGSDGRIELVMIKEKEYPETAASQSPVPLQAEKWHICDATPDSVRSFVAQLRATYQEHEFPRFLRSAGRLMDMVAGGEYGLVVALDPRNQAIGGALWHVVSERTIECFGPYLFFDDHEACAQDLMDVLIGRIAKSNAVCMVTRWPTRSTPKGSFEVLGHLRRCASATADEETIVLCRFLQEDAGCQVWTVPQLTSFLEGEYTRLCMARELITAFEEGKRRPAHSVFSARLDRQLGRATLTTVLDGSDVEENVARHVAALEADGFGLILFELDLATARDAMLTPILMANRFSPRLLVPYAGNSDVVVFQRNAVR